MLMARRLRGNVPGRISFVTGSNAGNRAERLKVGSTGNFTGACLRRRNPTLSLRGWRAFLVEPYRLPQPIDYRRTATWLGGISERWGSINGSQRLRRLAVNGWRDVVVGFEPAFSESAREPNSGHAVGNAGHAGPGAGPGRHGTSAGRGRVAAHRRWTACRRKSRRSAVLRWRWVRASPPSRRRAKRFTPARRMGASGFLRMPDAAGPPLRDPQATDPSSVSSPIRPSPVWPWRPSAALASTCCAPPTAADFGTI